MEAKEILARRDTLRSELANAHKTEHECRVALGAAEEQANAADRDRAAIFQRVARNPGLDPREVSAAEEERERTASLVESLTAQLKAARHAQVQVQLELDALLRDHLATFEEEAEEVTRAALVALEDLMPAYQRARNEWARAQAAWAPLRQPVAESVKAEKQAEGTWVDQSRIQHLAAVPDWVAQEPEFLINMPPPRPRALTPEPEIEVIEG